MSKPLFTGSEWNSELLGKLHDACAEIAHNEMGLDTYPNQFEIVDSERMLDAYASIGLPLMYNHWSFGKEFLKNDQSYKAGQSGLAYELVINSNPCINYLMDDNTATMQCLVIAHAGFGHNHLFKNNYLFKDRTDATAIVDYLVFAKQYIESCEEKYGKEAVEQLLDSCHALMNQGVDKYKRPAKLSAVDEKKLQKEREEHLRKQVNILWQTDETGKGLTIKKFPEEPEENLLKFFEKYSPVLETWQREVIRITRKIAQYFYPQRQCLVGNHLVSTDTGLSRLDKLIVEDDIVKNDSITLLTEGNKSTSTSHTYKTKAETLIIKTKSGRTFQGTPEHPLQVLGSDNVNFEMRELGNMKIGDNLVYRLDYDIFTKNDSKISYIEYDMTDCTCDICGLKSPNISSHLSQTHGIAISDYSGKVISDNYRIKRSSNKIVKFPELYDVNSSKLLGYLSAFTLTGNVFSMRFDAAGVAEDCCKLLDDVFGISVDVLDHYADYKISFSSMMLRDWVYKNIPNFNTLNRFELPEIVYSFNKNNIRNYLKSFFDTRITKSSFERGRVALSGYSVDYEDLQHLSVILTGFGIVPNISVVERESVESMCHLLGMPECNDMKAHDYIFRIKSDFINVYFDEIGTTHYTYKVLSELKYVYCGSDVFSDVKELIKKKCSEHCDSEAYRVSNYSYKKDNNILLKDTGLDMINLFPFSSKNGVLSKNITSEFKERLLALNLEDNKFKLLQTALDQIDDIYADEIVSIEEGGEEYVYDVTIPENHLFWTDGLISHNTKVINEGFATWTHHHIMNRLYDKGLITEGSMLEFMSSHAGVIYQPPFDSKYYSGYNPYALGLAIFQDIERMCKDPTEEDKEWFPNIAGRKDDVFEIIKDAAANYRDESFIRQFLSPKVIRDFKMFRIEDDDEDYYAVTSIHNREGYKKIRKALADSYEISNQIPNIQVINANLDNDRHLELHHYATNNQTLAEEETLECLKHIHTLWGFEPFMISFDAEGNDIDEFVLC